MDNNNKYKENPSIAQAMVNTKKGAKPIFNQGSGTDFSVYSHNSEEMKSIALDFVSKKVVDRDKFIKIYIHSLPVLSELKNSTKILFQYILMSLSEEVGKDQIYMSYDDYSVNVSQWPLMAKVSRTTYFSCINELLAKGVIYKSYKTNIYFINIAYIFNGDRLTFIEEYTLKKENDSKQVSQKEETDEELEKRFNERKFRFSEPEEKSEDEISEMDYKKMNDEVLDRVPLKELEKYPFNNSQWEDL
ncbi:hypothetical protein BPS26883_03460 [Burkholderia pseudomultivorans]|uniref:Plasmid replication protein RepL domain-containing protein n=1 Tax=Burkholderia pseudomultivorans TaxID=1207504 RepID=A0A6P2M2F7_9BURK|nr:hypothetical protein [Burkholderia pseudomultivorans]VWB72759.1 hypothetical protein BPS26883_03460 [Burkholderia pseudomultivorans]